MLAKEEEMYGRSYKRPQRLSLSPRELSIICFRYKFCGFLVIFITLIRMQCFRADEFSFYFIDYEEIRVYINIFRNSDCNTNTVVVIVGLMNLRCAAACRCLNERLDE